MNKLTATQLKCVLGKVGEDVEGFTGFTNWRNLNEIKSNFEIFDYTAERDGETYVFSNKARTKYQKNGKLNPRYNILSDETMVRRYGVAMCRLREMGYDTDKLHFCFIVVPVEEGRDCVYYWGKFTDVKSACTTQNILDGKVTLRVKVTDDCLAKYNVLGVKTWEQICEKFLA